MEGFDELGRKVRTHYEQRSVELTRAARELRILADQLWVRVVELSAAIRLAAKRFTIIADGVDIGWTVFKNVPWALRREGKTRPATEHETELSEARIATRLAEFNDLLLKLFGQAAVEALS